MATQIEMDEFPVILFVDTSSFEQSNFSFKGEYIKTILGLSNDSLIEIVSTDVTSREIRRRIMKGAVTAKNAIKKIKKEMRFLGHDRELWKRIFKKEYYDSLVENVKSEYEEFLENSGATLLYVDDVNPSIVFEQYFSVTPPFSVGKKEKEFPDAFVIQTLLNYSKSKGKQICIVSGDDDFKKACENHESFIFLPTIESAIDFVLRTSGALVDDCHEWLHKNAAKVYQHITQRLDQVKFSLDAPLGYINSKNYLNYELINEAVVEIKDTYAIIAFSAEVSVSFNVDYETEGESYYDSNDRLVIPYEDIRKDLHVYLLFPLRLKLSLSSGRIAGLQDITINVADEVEITPEEDFEYDCQSSDVLDLPE